MIRNLFKRKKPLVKSSVKKKQPPLAKTKRVTPKEVTKKPTQKILTAEGWKRLMLRPKATKAKKP
ncbi:MAG: hypothetical protein ACRDAI_01780 [Candidatus Rhabdochlamydia sp.]